MEQMMGDLFWQLNEDGRYLLSTQEGQETYGTWDVNSNFTEISDIPDIGEPSTNRIYSLQGDRLTLETNQVLIVLVKTDEQRSIPSKQVLSGASANAQQLAGKWMIIELQREDGSYNENLDIAEASFDFREDGTYTYETFGVQSEGTWSLNEEQGLLKTKVGDRTNQYLILSVSEDELRMKGIPTGGSYVMEAQTSP